MQCDQTARLLFINLPSINNENVSNSQSELKILPNTISKWTKFPESYVKLAKFRQIWSHWVSVFLFFCFSLTIHTFLSLSHFLTLTHQHSLSLIFFVDWCPKSFLCSEEKRQSAGAVGDKAGTAAVPVDLSTLLASTALTVLRRSTRRLTRRRRRRRARVDVVDVVVCLVTKRCKTEKFLLLRFTANNDYDFSALVFAFAASASLRRYRRNCPFPENGVHTN